MLQAIRSQYDNPTPKESGESLNMARDITKGEVIYDYLQQESGNRELTDAEWWERLSAITLIVCVAAIGCFPNWISDLIRQGVEPITNLLSQAL